MLTRTRRPSLSLSSRALASLFALSPPCTAAASPPSPSRSQLTDAFASLPPLILTSLAALSLSFTGEPASDEIVRFVREEMVEDEENEAAGKPVAKKGDRTSHLSTTTHLTTPPVHHAPEFSEEYMAALEGWEEGGGFNPSKLSKTATHHTKSSLACVAARLPEEAGVLIRTKESVALAMKAPNTAEDAEEEARRLEPLADEAPVTNETGQRWRWFVPGQSIPIVPDDDEEEGEEDEAEVEVDVGAEEAEMKVDEGEGDESASRQASPSKRLARQQKAAAEKAEALAKATAAAARKLERRQVRQYLVKLRGHSYNRLEWQRADEIEEDGKLSKNCLSRFLRRLAAGETIDKEYRSFAVAQRIIGHRVEGGFGKEYLVKWTGLPYSECSWEHMMMVPQSAIDAYNVASNRTAVEAAKQQREREMGWLSKGKTLEVYPAPDDMHELRGAWYGATAITLHDTHVYVEYKHLLANEDDVDASSLRERVPLRRVRPLPPRSRKDWRPEVGEAIAAEHLDGWWGGRVLAVAKRGDVLPDLRAPAVKAAEVQQLLQPPLAPADPGLQIGQTAEGRDGRQWELIELEGSTRRVWQLAQSQALPLVLPSAAAAEASPAMAGAGERRKSGRDARLSAPKPSRSNFLRNVYRPELPGMRIVVTYTEDSEEGEAKPECGAELCGHFIEVHWPLDRAWYRAKVCATATTALDLPRAPLIWPTPHLSFFFSH